MNYKRQLVEAYIFSKTNGIKFEDIQKKFKFENNELKRILTDIQVHFLSNEHGVELANINSKFLFQIKPELKSQIVPNVKKINLTETQFEILAIIFLNGPSRLGEIERSRGKNSYAQIKKLLDYGIIKRIKIKNSGINHYALSEKFYNWIPEETIEKLEEIKNANITKSTTDNGNIEKKSS